MKFGKLTRREVASMTDDDLAKAHSEIHGIDANLPKDMKNKQKVAFEAHSLLAAEMDTRSMGHKTPLGWIETGQTPASSTPHGSGQAPAPEDGPLVAGADQNKKGLDGGMSGVDGNTKIRMGKAWFLLQNMRKALDDAFGEYMVGIEEFDLDGPAVIVYSYENETSAYYRVPFSINEDGDITLDVEGKTEVEPLTTYVTAKEADVDLVAPVVKESMDDEKRFALYIVYIPEVDDSQGERMTKEAIEQACWSFGRKCYLAQGNRIDVQHAEDVEKHSDCHVVENFVSREDGWMGQPAGTWYIGIIHGPTEWEMLKNGEINGVSMAGRAKTVEHEVEED